MNQTYFKVFTDRAGEFRWRLVAGNGEIVATSEGYTSYTTAKESAQKVHDWAGRAVII